MVKSVTKRITSKILIYQEIPECVRYSKAKVIQSKSITVINLGDIVILVMLFLIR